MTPRAPTITANATPEVIEGVRVAAFSKKQTIRQWAGEAIEKALESHRRKRRPLNHLMEHHEFYEDLGNNS